MYLKTRALHLTLTSATQATRKISLDWLDLFLSGERPIRNLFVRSDLEVKLENRTGLRFLYIPVSFEKFMDKRIADTGLTLLITGELRGR